MRHKASLMHCFGKDLPLIVNNISDHISLKYGQLIGISECFYELPFILTHAKQYVKLIDNLALLHIGLFPKLFVELITLNILQPELTEDFGVFEPKFKHRVVVGCDVFYHVRVLRGPLIVVELAVEDSRGQQRSHRDALVDEVNEVLFE